MYYLLYIWQQLNYNQAKRRTALDREIRGQRRIIERIAQLSASGIRHQPQSGIQPLRDK